MKLSRMLERVKLLGIKLNAKMRYWVSRSSFRIPEFAFDSDFKVYLATTQEDFESAFRLLYDDAVTRKLIQPKESNVVCPIHSVLPQTATIVVKYKDYIVGTAALVQDSKVGFYCEKYFAAEIANVRTNQRHSHVELAYLAVDKGFKRSTLAIIHLIMKFTMVYTKRHLKVKSLIMAINPALEEYFAEKWQFKTIGPRIRYNSSAASALTLMQLDLSQESRRIHRKRAPTLDIRENPALFIAKKDKRFIFPEMPKGQIIYPAMSAKMLQLFCLKMTSLYEEFDLQTRQIFLEMYMQFYGVEQMQAFLNLETEIKIREFRLPIQTQVSVRVGDNYLSGTMRDLSSTGCFFELPFGVLGKGEKVYLSFKIGDLELNVHAMPIWHNRNQHIRYGEGYGVRFDNPLLQITEEVKTWSTRLHKTAC